MNFNKKFLTVPAILAAICVASGGLIGAIHYGTSAYQAAHKTSEAPKEIKALYGDSSYTFAEVEGFVPSSSTESTFRVKIEACYRVLKDGAKVGYAYMVNCGKPVNTEVLMAISYHGEPGDNLAPAAINLYQGGDSGYGSKAETLADQILSGETSLDNPNVQNGATRSSKALLDGITATMRDYKIRWAGGDGPIEAYPAAIKTMYPELEDAREDTSFKPIAFSTPEKENAGSVNKRYLVSLKEGKTAVVYLAKGSADDLDPGHASGEVSLFFAWESEVTPTSDVAKLVPSKFALDENTMTKDEWKDVYIPGILDGTKSLDDEDAVKVGATLTSNVVRAMLLAERNDYFHYALLPFTNAWKAMFGEGYTWNRESYQAIDGPSFAYDDGGEGNGKATARTLVTNQSGVEHCVISTYGEVEFDVGGGDIHHATMNLFVSFAGADASTSENTIAPTATYVASVTGMAYSQWESAYLPHVTDIEFLEDPSNVVTEATVSSYFVRNMVLTARKAYLAYLAE